MTSTELLDDRSAPRMTHATADTGRHASPPPREEVRIIRPSDMPWPWRARPKDAGRNRDRSGDWLRCAMLALGVLAVAAAAVSFAAQYQMVLTARSVPVIAALEAGIPDAGAVIFGSLGIALALHGRRAIRARVLNLGAVATSITMNWLAAGHGWRDLAIFVMPPVAYALASDTAISVVRAWAIARARQLSETLADDDTTPLALAGGAALWLLRLTLAPASTLRGFRAWVLDECPVAPGRTAVAAQLAAERPRAIGPARPGLPRPRQPRGSGKTARFLALVTERYGPLAGFPLDKVSRVAAELAPEVDLHPGSARAALRQAVLDATDGGRS